MNPETPSTPANPATTTPAPTSEGTGSPADAAPVEHAPTPTAEDLEGQTPDTIQSSPEVDQKGRDAVEDVVTPLEEETEEEKAESAADLEQVLARETQDGPGNLDRINESEVETNLEDEQ